jgi:lipopolysaccharide/colanic/teichoic acid biosynthesis glycosyltransferase
LFLGECYGLVFSAIGLVILAPALLAIALAIRLTSRGSVFYLATQQRLALSVRFAITGLASVWYRHEERLLSGEDWEKRYIEEVMPRKLHYDLEYLERLGLAQDLKVIGRTVLALFR